MVARDTCQQFMKYTIIDDEIIGNERVRHSKLTKQKEIVHLEKSSV